MDERTNEGWRGAAAGHAGADGGGRLAGLSPALAALGVGGAEAKQPTLMRALEEAGYARQGAMEVRAALETFATRLCGSVPEDPGNTTREDFGPGVVGDLRNMIEDTRDVLRAIRDTIRRLDKIA